MFKCWNYIGGGSSGGSGNGTWENPFTWDQVVDPQYINQKHSIQLNTCQISSQDAHNRVYIAVTLQAGTQYSIGMSGGDFDQKCYMYTQQGGNQDGQQVASGDDQGPTIDDFGTQGFTYTPQETGIYIIGAGAFETGCGTIRVHISPVPATSGGSVAGTPHDPYGYVPRYARLAQIRKIPS